MHISRRKITIRHVAELDVKLFEEKKDEKENPFTFLPG